MLQGSPWAEEVGENARKIHPERSCRYDLQVSPQLRFIEGVERGSDQLFVEWIRHASNVSNSFRAELAHEFWANVCLETTGWGQNIRKLLSMLKERPAIHKGIKRLKIYQSSVETQEDLWASPKDFEDFAPICQRTCSLKRFLYTLVSTRETSRYLAGAWDVARLWQN